ncbi:hypothetical protein AKJ16_DCAP18560 [Drosera capensis]
MVSILQQVGSGVTSVLTAGPQNSLNMGVRTLHSGATVAWAAAAAVTVAFMMVQTISTKIILRTTKLVMVQGKRSVLDVLSESKLNTVNRGRPVACRYNWVRNAEEGHWKQIVIQHSAMAPQATVAPECKLLTPMFTTFCGPAVQADVVPGRSCCVMLDMMNSRMDAQAACQCIKASLQNITGYNWVYSSQIPNKCGAYPSFPISRGINCSR